MNLPLVSIFILNWNRLSETIRAINSAIGQTYPNTEIIVVDNGSTEKDTIKVLSSIKEIKFISLDKNYGCPGGRNRGIPYCNGEFIFFCDNDGVLHEKAVENAINCILKDNSIAVITGLVLSFNEESEIDTQVKIDSKPPYPVALFQGGISMHSKFIYDKISYYPDDYMYGGEESFLSLKVFDAGFKIIKTEDVILWHKQSILARNVDKESIRKWRNGFMNAFQLFPIEYFILFAIYYLIKYPFYSYKHKIFKYFIKSLFILPKDIKGYKRKPVSRQTYKLFKNLNKQNSLR